MIDEADMELFFEATYEVLGKQETSELVPGGHELRVTDANRVDYVERMAQWRLTRGTEQQNQKLLGTFVDDSHHTDTHV